MRRGLALLGLAVVLVPAAAYADADPPLNPHPDHRRCFSVSEVRLVAHHGNWWQRRVELQTETIGLGVPQETQRPDYHSFAYPACSGTEPVYVTYDETGRWNLVG